MVGVGVDDSHANERGDQNTDNVELCIGKKFDTSDELFALYKEYAKRVGFVVRKRSQRRNDSGIVRSMSYVCNRQGMPINGGKKPTNPLKSKRCGCKAYVTARLDNENRWEITQLALDHNHPISPSKSRQYRFHQTCMKFSDVADLASGSDEQCKIVNENERGEQNTDNGELCIGNKFDTSDELFALYKEYAKGVGFTVRKRSQRRNDSGIIRSMSYVCNRQGMPINEGKNPTKPQKSKRCGCKVKVTARLDNEDRWEITQLALDHNHPISPNRPRHCCCHQSCKKFSDVADSASGSDEQCKVVNGSERGEQNTNNGDLCIGRKFDTSDELFALYKEYAKRVGFTVRKRSQRRDDSGIIRSLSYVCNRQGMPINGGKNPTKPQKSNRCGCKAYVTARLDNEDKWEITQLVVDHNHPMSHSKSRHYRCHQMCMKFGELNESSLRYNQMCMKFCDVADLASGSDEQCKVVNEWLDDKIKEFAAKSVQLEKPKADEEVQGDKSASKVCDPIRKKRKGRPTSTRLEAKRKMKPSTKSNQNFLSTDTPENVATIPTPSQPQDSVLQQKLHARSPQGSYLDAPCVTATSDTLPL